METRKSNSSLSRKTLVWIQILFLFCFFESLQCQHTLETVSSHQFDRLVAQSPSPSKAPTFKSRGWRILFSIIFGSITGLVIAIGLAILVRFFVLYVNRTPILKGPVIFSPKISPRTLQSALANETQLLGSSLNGKYYRVVLDNGLVVAVKQLEPLKNGSPEMQSKSVKRRIQGELEMLAQLRDRNLMSLRAYIRESNHVSLVYDYMPNGSLEDAMMRVRANQMQLGWEIRHRIAVGVIKGLRYLHFDCSTRVLHCNLKPANVMLDEEFEPRLGDCGLAKLMPNMGEVTTGYIAPECFQSSRYTDKSDIFSFGVILGVLLTGRDPLDTFFSETGGGSLGRWLRHLQQVGEPREGLDKALLGEEVEEEEMLMAVRIALVCLSDLPADRPSSDELVPMLTQLHSF